MSQARTGPTLHSDGVKKMDYSVGILTVSDRCFRKETKDESGPALAALVAERTAGRIVETALVPDDRKAIADVLRRWSDDLRLDLILTTGGTGFAPRDLTPEATKDVTEREAPGLAEAMRAHSLKQTPHAMLSRAVAAIRGGTLIVNLPGSPTAAAENLEAVLPALPHGIEIMKDLPGANQRHRHTHAG